MRTRRGICLLVGRMNLWKRYIDAYEVYVYACKFSYLFCFVTRFRSRDEEKGKK
jgi:hypothetical protein